MKYGQTLQQRSILAWRAHNVDYDEIKHFIKKRTSPGDGETISVPGHGDEKLAELDGELSEIFTQQHERINLFVKSKVGEIKRRLEHAKQQLRQLSLRKVVAADRRIPIARLERYSKLENDVVKIGNEIRSLARFTSTNRTAFRKLLKKARKWTRESQLCHSFELGTLNGGQSFLRLDFGALLDDYAQTLANIRSLYERRMKGASTAKDKQDGAAQGTSVVERLHAATKTGSKVDFDTAISIVPLGETGNLANYFVHPDNIVELQVLLLQNVQPYAGRSRHGSLNGSPTAESPRGVTIDDATSQQDYHMLVADNVERFAKVEGAMTVNEREHLAGAIPQRAKYFIRWTNDEDAVLASRSSKHKVSTTTLKRKHADTVFDADAPERRGSEVTFAGHSLAALREEMSKDSSIEPLYKICTARQRFVGIGDKVDCKTLATLDSHITIDKRCKSCRAESETPTSFPYAVLQVRSEGGDGQELIQSLDASHLVERVRGFSLQYHAFWQTCRPTNMSVPFWMPILSRDIRKLPPPAKARNDSLMPRSPGTGSGNQHSTGPSSVRGLTDETTAVETPRQGSTAAADFLETPPLKSFRKKRRRRYAERDDIPPEPRQQQSYWNEYDNPSDGEDADAYVILIDPNERSLFDRCVDYLASLFSLRRKPPREPDADPSTPVSPADESSSEDEEAALLPPQRSRGYGTQNRHHSANAIPPTLLRTDYHQPLVPQITSLTLTASLAILAITFILAFTSKHKYARTVDAAVVFAIVCSLVFAGVGLVALMRQRARERRWRVVGVAVGVVVVDAVCCGGLLAWMLG